MRVFCTLALAVLLGSPAWTLSVSVSVMADSYCGRPSGRALAFPDGGVPPYSYQWSDGSTAAEAVGLFAGSYSVTVTDSQMDQATAEFTIALLTSYPFDLYSYWVMGHCPGDPAEAAIYTGMEQAGVQPPLEGIYGPNPYNFSHPQLTGWIQASACNIWQNPVLNVLQFEGLAPGSHTVEYTDAEGCPGQAQVIVGPEIATLPVVQVLNVTPSCASTATGAITYAMQGGLPYSYKVKLRPANVTDPCSNLIDIYTLDNSFPGLTRTVSNLLPGDHWLITTNDLFDLDVNNPMLTACADSILVTVPSLGTDCGLLTGRVYIDDVADCIMAGAENRVPGTIVEITPGPYYVTTNSTGQYSIGLAYGNYTVTEQHPVFEQSCPGSVTLASATQIFNVGCAGGEPLDVQLAMANGPARPGFELHYAIDLDNLTPASPGTVTLTVTIDPLLGFINATPAPSSVVGNVLTWTAPQLVMDQVFAHRDISIRTQVPPDVGLIGSTLTTSAQVTTANTDGDLTNNAATSDQLVTGSYDPNDKLANTSMGNSSVWLINEDEWIDYTIRFQNTGTDTAFNVVITDTLPPTLDPGSIIWGAASHAHTRMLEGQGVLKFTFPNILLPDSNVNEPLSHGFVGFRIRPHLPLLPGEAIENIANIYFDFNPPVITEPSVLVASTGTAIGTHRTTPIGLLPNPATDRIRLVDASIATSVLSWSIIATDGRVVRTDHGPFPAEGISIAPLRTGTYALRLQLNDGVITERFIKTAHE